MNILYFFCFYMLNVGVIIVINLDQEGFFFYTDTTAYLCCSNTLLNSVVGNFFVCVSIIFLLEVY